MSNQLLITENLDVRWSGIDKEEYGVQRFEGGVCGDESLIDVRQVVNSDTKVKT